MKNPGIAFGAVLSALALTACASTDDGTAMESSPATTQSAQAAEPAQTQPAEPATAQPTAPSTTTPSTPSTTAAGGFTDTQLRSFLGAYGEITPIIQAQQANLQGTPEQQEAARVTLSEAAAPIFARHGIDATTYNRIAQAAQTDTALQQRLGELQAAASPSSTTPSETP